MSEKEKKKSTNVQWSLRIPKSIILFFFFNSREKKKCRSQKRWIIIKKTFFDPLWKNIPHTINFFVRKKAERCSEEREPSSFDRLIPTPILEAPYPRKSRDFWGVSGVWIPSATFMQGGFWLWKRRGEASLDRMLLGEKWAFYVPWSLLEAVQDGMHLVLLLLLFFIMRSWF